MDIEHQPAPAGRLKAFPVGWVTSGRTLLIVGGCMGDLCRLRHALAFDWARIRVLKDASDEAACETCPQDDRVTIETRPPEEADVGSADLVIDCTMDKERAARLGKWCRQHRVPLNAMDKLEWCDIHYPALLLRGPMALAILTGGEAPALSSRMRKWLEEQLGEGWALAARLFAETRNRLPEGKARMELLKRLAAHERLPDFIRANDEPEFRKWIDDEIRRMGNLG